MAGRGEARRLGLVLVLSVLVCSLQGARAAEMSPADLDRFPVPPEPAFTSLETAEDWADMTHRDMSDRVLATARWLDSFFSDERYAEEQNRTRIKVKAYAFVQEEGDSDYKLRASIRLALPHTENRLMLFVGGEEGEGQDEDEGTRDGTDGSERFDDTGLGLRFFLKSLRDRNISAKLGGRIRGGRPVISPGLRWRETVDFTDWILRLVENVRWYSDEGWESKTTLDFDCSLTGRRLFRTTLEGFWSQEQEDDKGFTLDLNFALIQSLSRRRAVTFEWNNRCKARPSHRLDATTLKVRYRQRVWRQWLFFEVSPQVAWRHEDDYEWRPGCEVRLECIFGHTDGGGPA